MFTLGSVGRHYRSALSVAAIGRSNQQEMKVKLDMFLTLVPILYTTTFIFRSFHPSQLSKEKIWPVYQDSNTICVLMQVGFKDLKGRKGLFVVSLTERSMDQGPVSRKSAKPFSAKPNHKAALLSYVLRFCYGFQGARTFRDPSRNGPLDSNTTGTLV